MVSSSNMRAIYRNSIVINNFDKTIQITVSLKAKYSVAYLLERTIAVEPQ